MTRQVHDVIALYVHLIMTIVVAVYVIGGRDDAYEQTRLGLILGVELISFVFHACIVAGWQYESNHKYMHKFWKYPGTDDDYWNWLKWAEYAITATMGTISVGIKRARHVASGRIALLCTVLAIGGVVQQITGYYIDRPNKAPLPDSGPKLLTSDQTRGLLWLGAVGWQIFEFFIVANDNWGFGVDAKGALFIVYAAMWSVFGVIAALRSAYLADFVAASAFDVNVTETLYSAFGWMAKLAVSTATLTDIVGTGTYQTTVVGIVFAAIVPVVALVFTFGARHTKRGYEPDDAPFLPSRDGSAKL